MGKTFLLLLNVLDQKNPKALSPYANKYLRLMACRLLDGYNTEAERAAGLSVATFSEIKYHSAPDLKTDFEKLLGTYNLNSRLPEVDGHLQETIQVSTLAGTPFTSRVEDLLNHPTVMRLGAFTQLGLLNFVYPTAIHTRLEHSLGTFTVCCRYVAALYNDPLNPLFKQIMTESDLKAVIITAFLHDIGQYPLAHDLEEADPQFFSHEEIGFEILGAPDELLRNVLTRSDSWNISPEQVVSILRADPVGMRGTLKDRILHSLIDGPLDADKVDYLIRDILNLGLTYGRGIDLERLLRTLTIIFREQDRQTYATLGIHEKGKVPAEAVFFARYAMFGQVYWHHTYRSIKSMLHRMVWEMRALNPRDQLRVAFKAFVLPVQVNEGTQQRLFPGPQDLAATPVSGVSQINQTDLAMLEWIAAHSGAVGRDMLDLMRSRSLFKRILVFSKERAPDSSVLNKLIEFQRSSGRRWEPRRDLQKTFQKKVVERIDGKPLDHMGPPTAAITADVRNNFIADGRERVLLLVDIPPDTKASKQPLEYLVEEDRHRYKLDEVLTGSLEESAMWKALQGSFRDSIGKARLFCHPAYSKFVSAFLDRAEIENCLSDALDSIEA